MIKHRRHKKWKSAKRRRYTFTESCQKFGTRKAILHRFKRAVRRTSRVSLEIAAKASIALIIFGFVILIIGYAIGYGTVYTFFDEKISGWSNPTYQEMISFINEDMTESNAYTWSYVCEDFSMDVIRNARSKGFRAGFVGLDEPSGSGHAIVCFDTSDKGLYFLEPQMDKVFSKAELDNMVSRRMYDISIAYGDGTSYFDMALSGYGINWYRASEGSDIPYWGY